MKTGIHPAYQPITVTCACGNNFSVGSTMKENLRVEICAQCHPLYTGKSKLVDTAGRVDKFKARKLRAETLKGEAKSRTKTTDEETPTEEADSTK